MANSQRVFSNSLVADRYRYKLQNYPCHTRSRCFMPRTKEGELGYEKNLVIAYLYIQIVLTYEVFHHHTVVHLEAVLASS